MNQLKIFATSTPKNLYRCPWARPARHWPRGVVLALPATGPTLGIAPWLREQGWRLVDSAEDRGQQALLLAGGSPDTLLSVLPKPPSHGSNTPGNLLPW